jgi:hypothetical protein
MSKLPKTVSAHLLANNHFDGRRWSDRVERGEISRAEVIAKIEEGLRAGAENRVLGLAIDSVTAEYPSAPQPRGEMSDGFTPMPDSTDVDAYQTYVDAFQAVKGTADGIM